jgi:hypothetical protein
MTVSFSDIFFSHFQTRTFCYLDEPLSEWIEAFDQKKHLPQLTDRITRLFCEVDVAQIFKAPFAYDEDTIQKNIQVLQKGGFTFLSQRFTRSHHPLPHYSALEHPSLDGWVIKPCGKRVPDSTFVFGPTNQYMEMAYFTDEDGLYRIPMRQRIQRIAKEENIPVILPKKYYVKIPFSTEEDPKKSYFIIAEKIPVLSAEESIDAIKKMSPSQQTTLAFQICRLIQLSGFLDASMSNIRLTKEGRLAIIDTEPAGFLRDCGNIPFFPWNRYGHHGTLEKSGRIGMHRLREEFIAGAKSAQMGLEFNDALAGLTPFKEMVDEMISRDDSLKPNLLSKCICLLSLGLFPLVWAILSFVKATLLSWLYEKHDQIRLKYQERRPFYTHLNYAIRKEKDKRFQRKMNLILRMIHLLQEDVPRRKPKPVPMARDHRGVEC